MKKRGGILDLVSVPGIHEIVGNSDVTLGLWVCSLWPYIKAKKLLKNRETCADGMEKFWCCYPVVKDGLQLHKITEPSFLTRSTHPVLSSATKRHIQDTRHADCSSSWSSVWNKWLPSCIPVSCTGHGCSAAPPLGCSPCINPCSGFWLWHLSQNCLSFSFKLQNTRAAPAIGALPLGSIPCSPCALGEDTGSVESPTWGPSQSTQHSPRSREVALCQGTGMEILGLWRMS